MARALAVEEEPHAVVSPVEENMHEVFVFPKRRELVDAKNRRPVSVGPTDGLREIPVEVNHRMAAP